MSKELKIGIVVTGALIFLIYGYNFLKGYNLISPRNEYVVVYPKIDGLVEASPVLLNGQKVGQVNSTGIHPEHVLDSVKVTFSLDNRIRLFPGTEAKIISADILGSKAIELIVGNRAVEPLLPGAQVKGTIDRGLEGAVDEHLKPLKAKIDHLIGSADSLIVVFQSVLNEDMRNSLTSSFQRIPKAIRNIENATVTIDTLVNDQKEKLSNIFSDVESITHMLKRSNHEISAAISNIKNMTDSLAQADLKEAINNANQSMAQANELLTKINNSEGTLGLMLNDSTLYNEMIKSSNSVNELLKDLKENPHRYMHISLIDFHKE